MGVCDWFKTIIRKRKKKGGRLKQVEWSYPNGKESSFLSTCNSSRKAGGRSMPTQDIAAMWIQTAFRAYVARKALRCLKGTVRFQALVEADAVTKQALAALNRIHFWSKIQGEVRARRICMVTEGRTRQRKLENQLKVEAKLHELEVEWCGGPETMEEIVSKIQQREEATMKRERAMAYAFSHQWRANNNRYFGQVYYDLSKEIWGWSWMERWITVCPWETRVVAQQENKAGKRTKHPPTNILVSVKPHLGNGNGTTKAINCAS